MKQVSGNLQASLPAMRIDDGDDAAVLGTGCFLKQSGLACSHWMLERYR